MIISEVLTIGDELLRGERTDTNSSWLGKVLTENGAEVIRITTVGDEVCQISNEIERIVKGRAELGIITGGLGPTLDDRTLKALALALDKKLVLDEKALKMVRESYSKLTNEGKVKKKKLNPARKKMAKIPEGAEAIFNPAGTAPAVLVKEENTKIFCLPGIPEEMKSIIVENLEKLELSDSKHDKSFRTFDITGRGESTLAPLLEELKEEFMTAQVSSYPSIGTEKPKVKVRISDKTENLQNLEVYFRKLIEDLEGAKLSK